MILFSCDKIIKDKSTHTHTWYHIVHRPRHVFSDKAKNLCAFFAALLLSFNDMIFLKMIFHTYHNLYFFWHIAFLLSDKNDPQATIWRIYIDKSAAGHVDIIGLKY